MDAKKAQDSAQRKSARRLRAIRLRVSWQTPWLTDVPLRGRIPRSHACATRHIPLSFTFFAAVSLLLGILSTLGRQQPPLAQRRRASRALSRHVPRPFPYHHRRSCPPPDPRAPPLRIFCPASPRRAAGLSSPAPGSDRSPFLLIAFHVSSVATSSSSVSSSSSSWYFFKAARRDCTGPVPRTHFT